MSRILGFFSEKTTDTGTDLTTKGDMHGYSDTNTRIPVGTNNQSLLGASGEALGLKWGASSTSTLTTAGDLLYASGANTLARLARGSDNQVLKMNGTALNWETLSSGGWEKVGTGNLSGGVASSLTLTGITKKKYLNIFFWGGFSSADELGIQMGDGSIDTGSNYSWTVTKNGANSTTATGTSGELMNSTSGSNIYCQFFMHNNTADLNQWGGIMHTGSDIYTFVGYWNDSDQIDQLKFFGAENGNNLGTNAIVNVYGVD